MGAHHAPTAAARRSGHATRRHAASVATPHTASAARMGRLAGRGLLTASATLAMAGAGTGAALAHDDSAGSTVQDLAGDRGLIADNDVSLLCGILGDCSDDDSGSSGSSSDTSDEGSEVPEAEAMIDRITGAVDADGSRSGSESPQRGGADREATSETLPERTSAEEAAERRDTSSERAPAQQERSTQQERSGQQAQQASGQQDASIDTPPAPGEVRTIDVPG